jgi:hypothetical protein
MADITIANLRYSTWVAVWGSLKLGALDKADPSKLKMKLEPIMTGSTGQVIIGYRALGVEGMVSLTLLEITQAQILALHPWNGGSVPGGGILMSPPLNTDLYIYAQTLRLHPDDVIDSDVTCDILIGKATPSGVYNIPKTNKKDKDKWEVDFLIMPDRTAIQATPSTATFGTVGGA